MICGLDDFEVFKKTFRLLAQILLSRFNGSDTVAAKASLNMLVNSHDEFKTELENDDADDADDDQFDDSGKLYYWQEFSP